MKLYVASSWRNQHYAQVLAALRKEGHVCYDFRNPFPGNEGFSWAEIDADWRDWTPDAWATALLQPIADRGFRADFEAMHEAEGCVLVMPSGRSAHIEAGWFAGAGKPVWAFVPESAEPELMYQMFKGGMHSDLESMCRLINRHRVYSLKHTGGVA